MKNLFTDIDLQTVKGILIDFDNTLYEYAPCHKVALNAVYEWYKQNHEILYDDFALLYGQAQKDVKVRTKNQAASHSRLLYFQRMLEGVTGKTDVQESLKMEDIYWDHFIKTIVMRDNITDFLATCRKNGIKICLITDLTASVQFRKMVATGVDKMVDFVVTSEESGVEKPDHAIFSLALEKLGLTKDDVVMIGDDIVKDIDGANTFGIKAYMAY